jgi:hypothetical protein
MTITAASSVILNRMNRAAQKVGMGTEIRRVGLDNDILVTAKAARTVIIGASGSATVTAAQASASRVVFTTGLSTIKGFEGQSRRSGSAVLRVNWVSGSVAGILRAMSGTSASALPLAENDSLYYIAW